MFGGGRHNPRFHGNNNHYHHHYNHHHFSHSHSVCNNCGKPGHMFHQCKLPIVSYGIILFRLGSEGQPEYLMIRRKDSFGFIDFVRGKYSVNNRQQMQNIVNEMSTEEKQRILDANFPELWVNMWGANNIQYKNEEASSSKKMELIKQGLVINGETVTLQKLVEQSTTEWHETEWEFPKGRKNHRETDLDCALREFEEETGINKHCAHVIQNLLPFEETFTGTNGKPYKHKYFLACLDNDFVNHHLGEFQPSEVSKQEWKTIGQCLESIRPYNLEKKAMIANVDKVLQRYKIYS